MLARMNRRGFTQAIEQWPHAILGHRRLSIFDLSDAGNQPMVSDDRSVAVVFNGAIYNFLELKSELIRAGCKFRSRTDTEVLVHGYREWGLPKLLTRLRGMFAIGLWDDREQKLYLIRDRLGVKPLVYAADQGRCAFACQRRGAGSGWIQQRN
jgi:asparagine synthase (glutamine-hydrolysing)